MAGGKMSPRQKMINLMYLVFIAMLAMNMSKEVLSAFGFINEDLVESNKSLSLKNKNSYENLDTKAQDQVEKFGLLKVKADKIKSLSTDYYVYLEGLKTEMIEKIEDKSDYESMDKTDFLDAYFFKGDGFTVKGKEFVDRINSYKDGVVTVLGSDYGTLTSIVNKRFNTDSKGNIPWLKHRFEGFPMVASLTNFTKLQANIKNTENDILSSLLGGQLESDSKLTTNNYKGIVRLDKTAYFSDEKVTGQVVLGRYDSNLIPSKVTMNGRDITKSVKDGQVLLNMAAGSVGEKTIKGVITFIQDGKPEDIPFESSYTVIPEPNDVVISADAMNVVYRGVDNPVSISLPGVSSNKLIVRTTGGLITKRGSGWIIKPGRGTELTVNVSATLSSGKKVNSPKKFRVKDIPTAMGMIRGEFGVVRMPKTSIGRATISAGLPDFVFDLKLRVNKFTVKVPGQLAVTVNGTVFNAAAKRVLARARRGDQITIFDIEAVIQNNTSYKLNKVLPIIIEVSN
jgi:gliding motility-associated protein GldM